MFAGTRPLGEASLSAAPNAFSHKLPAYTNKGRCGVLTVRPANPDLAAWRRLQLTSTGKCWLGKSIITGREHGKKSSLSPKNHQDSMCLGASEKKSCCADLTQGLQLSYPFIMVAPPRESLTLQWSKSISLWRQRWASWRGAPSIERGRGWLFREAPEKACGSLHTTLLSPR